VLEMEVCYMNACKDQRARSMILQNGDGDVLAGDALVGAVLEIVAPGCVALRKMGSRF
jgi:hypothetical protein